jgi:hypothetical protein
MEIGEPKRVVVIEPLEDPVPRRAPDEEEGAEPSEAPNEPEKAPNEPEKVPS